MYLQVQTMDLEMVMQDLQKMTGDLEMGKGDLKTATAEDLEEMTDKATDGITVKDLEEDDSKMKIPWITVEDLEEDDSKMKIPRIAVEDLEEDEFKMKITLALRLRTGGREMAPELTVMTGPGRRSPSPSTVRKWAGS